MQGKGAQHAWNYIDRDLGLSTFRSVATVVSQPRVGLRPDRWRGTGALRRGHPPGSRWHLADAPAVAIVRRHPQRVAPAFYPRSGISSGGADVQRWLFRILRSDPRRNRGLAMGRRNSAAAAQAISGIVRRPA